MSDENYEPTKAELLAGLLTGNANMAGTNATIQRSHRFPVNLFVQIENMARVSEVPVSTIINLLIECGLEAVGKELPQQILEQLNICSKEQFERKTTSESFDTSKRKTAARSKAKSNK